MLEAYPVNRTLRCPEAAGDLECTEATMSLCCVQSSCKLGLDSRPRGERGSSLLVTFLFGIFTWPLFSSTCVKTAVVGGQK